MLKVMDNPTLLSPIERKITLSSSSNYLGSGINTFNVNRTQQTSDILTCHGNSSLATNGCYITESTGGAVLLGAFPALTATRVSIYEIFGNNVGVVGVFRIIGVAANNDEQEELLTSAGVTAVNTVLSYKCVNDVIQVSGNLMYAGRTLTCRPVSGGAPGPSSQHTVRLQIGGDFKLNPLFMCSNKNGRQRRARLVAIDGTAFGTAASNLCLHVFQNNAASGSTIFGIYNTKLKMYDIPIAQTAVSFGDDSVVELSAGEYGLFFKEATTTTTFITYHWELYYVD